MRHVSRTHRIALDWLFDRINLDFKIQIKFIDFKKIFLLTLWSKEVSRMMSGIILLTLFDISHFSSTVCTAAMAKRAQQERWWIFFRVFHRSCRLQLQWTRWRDVTENKILGDLLLQMVDQDNLMKRQICDNKEVDLGEPTSFLDHVYLGCTQRQCQISKDIVDNYRTMFESRISAGRGEKSPFPQNLRISSWSYDMEGYAKKCGTILWVDKQDDSAILQNIYFIRRWPSLSEGRIEICRGIVKSMLWNCSEMLIFGKNWTTWYIVVSN